MVQLPIPNNMLNMSARHQILYHRFDEGFHSRILFMAAPWVFWVESCVWPCRGFSRSNPINNAKYNTIVWTVWALILGTVPNIVLCLGSAPIITLSLGPVPNVFPVSLLINLFYAHAVFERSTDIEWHNPSGFSDGGVIRWKFPGCWHLKNKKYPSTINNHLLFDAHTAYSDTKEREKERERERENL